MDVAAQERLAAAHAYSHTKREFLDTEAAAQAGIVFQPLAADTFGAWSTEALAEAMAVE